MDQKLKELLEASKKLVDAMTEEQKERMYAAQRGSWVRSIVDWPKPKYKWINGVKVYDSIEDYYND